MTKTRKAKLKLNFPLIFWIRSLTNVRVLNIVYSIFFLHRGLELPQIFLIGLVFSIGGLVAEIPSSYLADRWGRKKSMILGTLLNLMYWVIFFFSHSFLGFAIGTFIFSVSLALFSGTDQALLYDTAKELKEEKRSKRLGKFFAADRMFKIFSPIIAIMIAKDLSEHQFQILISIDIIASILAFALSTRLTEADHKMDLEEQEAGVMMDAINILKKHPETTKAMMHHTLAFMSSTVLWHYFQAFYTDLGVTLWQLGVVWSMFSLTVFISHWFFSHRLDSTAGVWIRMLTWFTLLFLGLALIFYHISAPPILMYISFVLFVIYIGARDPLYSYIYNETAKSFNRATTLSVLNFLRSTVAIPTVLLAGYLVSINIIYPYYFSAVLVIISMIFFSPKFSQKK